MKRVGFFGGTFDPPHLGHTRLAKTAMHDMELDEMLWVLTPQSPLKTIVFSTLEQRIEMVNLCLLDESGMSLSMVDIERDAPFYTVDTAALIREAFPEPITLFFILGGDSLRNIVRWYRAEELIFRQVDGLIVARRPGDDLDLEALEKEMPGILSRTHFVEMPVVDISSYRIRQTINAGKSLHQEVSPAVLQYICSQGLYQTNLSFTDSGSPKE